MSDPGDNNARFNNANPTLVTHLALDDNPADGNYDVSNFLTTIDDSTSTIKGHVKVSRKFDTATFALYTISGVTDTAPNWFDVEVAYVSGQGAFTDGEELLFTFARTGDVGAQGVQGEQGTQGTQGEQGTQGTQGETGTQGTQGTDGLVFTPVTTSATTSTSLTVGTTSTDFGYSATSSALASGTGMLVRVADKTAGSTLAYVGTLFSQYAGGFGQNYQLSVILEVHGTAVAGTSSSWEFSSVGYQGAQGTQGVQGEQGTQGVQGEQGTQGTQGVQGETGTQGVQGETGTQGTTGTQGETGTQGTTGTQGETGIQGDTGTQGIQGTEGADGDKYSTAATGSVTLANSGTGSVTVSDVNVDYTVGQDITLAYDVSNIQYAIVSGYNSGTGVLDFNKTKHIGSGAYSVWSVNLAGAVGIAGAQGTQGVQGEAIQGTTGTQGTTGLQGTDGTQGVQGISGTADTYAATITPVNPYTATTFNIDHSFGTLDVLVTVWDIATGAEVVTDITKSTTNRVIIGFAVAPASGETYRVVVKQ
jgi:hypothetical protein